MKVWLYGALVILSLFALALVVLQSAGVISGEDTGEVIAPNAILVLFYVFALISAGAFLLQDNGVKRDVGAWSFVLTSIVVLIGIFPSTRFFVFLFYLPANVITSSYGIAEVPPDDYGWFFASGTFNDHLITALLWFFAFSCVIIILRKIYKHF